MKKNIAAITPTAASAALNRVGSIGWRREGSILASALTAIPDGNRLTAKQVENTLEPTHQQRTRWELLLTHSNGIDPCSARDCIFTSVDDLGDLPLGGFLECFGRECRLLAL